MIKNGKLFGKINIIDFLVVLVILVGIAAVAVFLFVPRGAGDELVMQYMIEEVDTFVADKVKVGDELYDESFSLDLGYVTAVEKGPSVSYIENARGGYSRISKDGLYSMIITGEVMGKKTSLGAEIGGKKYGVGHTFVLRAGDAKLYLRVYDIKLKSDVVSKEEAKQETSEVIITLYAPETDEFIAEGLNGNTAVTVAGNAFGTATEVKTAPSESFVEGNGGFVTASKPGYKSVTVEVAASGVLSDSGVTIDRRLYSIGDSVDVRIGNVKLENAKIKYIR